MESRDDDTRDRMSLAVALLIAACIIGLFCAVSIAIAQNIESSEQSDTLDYSSITPSRNYLAEHPFL